MGEEGGKVKKISMRLKYLSERGYPYIIALIATITCEYIGFNMMVDEEGFTELLNGLITLDSIIIGFLGAVMPVILSMKNESKFVKYVFEKDEENLFCKYLKITLLLGICNVVFCLVLQVRKTILIEYRLMCYYAWIFFTIVFLMATYRSVSYMIALIFSKDEEDNIGDDNITISETRRDEVKQKYKSNERKV